jgi:tetratricopeptide (TPR) repeat protein
MSQRPSQPGSQQPGSQQPGSQEIRSQLARILASPSFQAHPRSGAFLSHVVEKAITGRAGEIKQSTIGCEVFGRPADYEPKGDAIVRSVARVLREKLNDYYLAQGAGDPVRIEIPKGSYVPSFHLGFREPPAVPNSRWSRQAMPAAAMAACLFALVWAVGGNVAATRRTPLPRKVQQPIPDPSALYREGRQAVRTGDFARARHLLEAAESAAPADAMIHATLSADLLALGRNAAALEEARKAVAESRGLTPSEELEVEADFRIASGDYKAASASFAQLAGQHSKEPEYFRMLAYAQLASGQPRDCLATVARAQASDDGRLGIAEALCHAATGDFLGALPTVRRAEDYARKAGQRETYAHARLLEAGLLMSTPQWDQASKARDEARQICASVGDDACVINALRQDANQNVWTHHPKPALAAYRAALETATKQASTGETAELLDGEGVALMQMDDYAASSDALTQSMLLARQSGHGTAGVRLDMVELALVQGQDARAIFQAEQAERDAGSAGDHGTEAAARILKARALLQRNDFRGCASDLDTARRIIDKFHVTAGIPRSWRIARANLSRALGHPDEAARELAAGDEPGAPAADSDYNYRLARLEILLDQGRNEQAVALASDTLAMLDGGGDQSSRILITALLSDAYGNAGMLAEAKRFASAARNLVGEHTTPLSRKTALDSAARWGAAEPVLTALAR